MTSSKDLEKSQQPTSWDELLDEVFAQIHKSTPEAVAEAIAIQIQLARDARTRIEKEGMVVRNMRGEVLAHPAIKIEADAIRLYTSLLKSSQS